MSRTLKALEGIDATVAGLFETACEGIDFEQDWENIREAVLEAAEACLSSYNDFADRNSDAPNIKTYHFNTTDRRVFLAFDYLKKQQAADEARSMFETGSFTSPEEQKRKLKQMLQKAAELQKTLGLAGDNIDLEAIMQQFAG